MIRTWPNSYLQLGHVLKLQGRKKEAEAAYLRAVILDGSAAEPLRELDGLGWSEAQTAELRSLLHPPDAPPGLNLVTDTTPTRDMPEGAVAAPDLGSFRSDGRKEGIILPADQAHNTRERDLRARISACGLFDPEVYLSLHEDLRATGADPWKHFLKYGLNEARHFTNPTVVARLLAEMDPQLNRSSRDFAAAAESALAGADDAEAAALLRQKGVRIGVFCSSEGNFFMREIADLFAWGLQAQGIEAVQRDETASKDERFDLRVFVAPHEFFYLGDGKKWTALAGAANSVLYNVEQVQTQWFCRAFPLLLRAPLVLDINFQAAEILNKAGCNVLHFMPGHLPTARYAQPRTDISDVELMKGYDFSRRPYNWLERNRLDDRPIDILFIGSSAPRREKAMPRLRELSDDFRFVCIYTHQDVPLTERNHQSTSTEINCALGQRAKIVLNVHRDWLGYFEWSRMVMQGFWQGACVVCDPGMPNPIYQSGVHFLEENARHIGELIRWLLGTSEGREKLNLTRMAGYDRARTLGSMPVALSPVLQEFNQLLSL